MNDIMVYMDDCDLHARFKIHTLKTPKIGGCFPSMLAYYNHVFMNVHSGAMQTLIVIVHIKGNHEKHGL